MILATFRARWYICFKKFEWKVGLDIVVQRDLGRRAAAEVAIGKTTVRILLPCRSEAQESTVLSGSTKPSRAPVGSSIARALRGRRQRARALVLTSGYQKLWLCDCIVSAAQARPTQAGWLSGRIGDTSRTERRFRHPPVAQPSAAIPGRGWEGVDNR